MHRGEINSGLTLIQASPDHTRHTIDMHHTRGTGAATLQRWPAAPGFSEPARRAASILLRHDFQPLFRARAPFKKFPAPHGATMSAPRSGRKFWARLENLILRAHKRRWRLAWKVILELAGPEADVGTALITCCVRAICERLAAPRRWWWYACTEVHGRRQRLTEAEIRTTTAR